MFVRTSIKLSSIGLYVGYSELAQHAYADKQGDPGLLRSTEHTPSDKYVCQCHMHRCMCMYMYPTSEWSSNSEPEPGTDVERFLSKQSGSVVGLRMQASPVVVSSWGSNCRQASSMFSQSQN